jgi:hypothetical protein
MVFVAACGERAVDPRSEAMTTPTTTGEARYEVDATVLQDETHGPQLCSGPVHTSMPPQCGGADMPGWDWHAVDGEQSYNETTWGEFHLVGTYDGATFRLTERPTRPERDAAAPPLPDTHTPCLPPPGGWSIVDPARLSFDDYNALQNAARAQPDFAGMWVDESTGRPDMPGDLTHSVLNVAFTQELDRHRRELAALWGGPICVVERARTDADLLRIRDELFGEFGPRIGLEVLSAGIGGADGPAGMEFVVWVDAMVVTDEMRRAVDEEFGTGVVVLHAALRPVD